MRLRVPISRLHASCGVWLICLTFAASAAATPPPQQGGTADGPPQSTIGQFELYPGSTYPGYGGIRGPTQQMAKGEILVPSPPMNNDMPPIMDMPPTDCAPNPWQPCWNAGIRAWFSCADSERSHGGPGPLFGNFADELSVLKWKRMSSEVIEANVNTLWFDKLLLIGEVGTGAIAAGQLRDKGFAVSGQQLLFSDTIHPAMDDDLLYINIDIGWRFCECEYFTFDGLAGYQYWRESYVAEGGARIVPPDPTPLPVGPVITEQFTWQGFRIGCQGVFFPDPRCAIKARVMFMPFSHFENDQVHRIGNDFTQPSSGVDTAAGGFGVMADIRASYNLWKGLFVELGYRVWDVESEAGETRLRFSDGTQAQLPFNGAHTTRHGLLFGLTYHF